MKDQRHIARGLAQGVSVALLLAVAWLWVRSYATLDELSHASGAGTIESIVSFRGGVHVSRSGERAGERRWTWDACDVPADADWDALYRTGSLEFRGLGFGWLRGKPFNTARPFGNTKTWPLVPWLNVTPYNAVVIPYWFIGLLVASPWWGPPAFGALLARLRSKPGACRRCGYDLRATPERCPECGLVPRRRPAPASPGVVA